MTRIPAFSGQTRPFAAVALILGVLVGAAFAYLPGKSYTASIVIYVAPPVSSSPTDAVMGDEYASNRAQLYLSLIKSEPLLAAVAGALDVPSTPPDIADRVSASALHQTSLIRIDATGPTPEAAVALAKAYGVTLPDFAETVEAQSGVREGPTVGVVTTPDAIRAEKVGMAPTTSIPLFGMAFALVGLLVGIWYRRKHPVVRGPADLRKVVNSTFFETVQMDRMTDDLERVQALIMGFPRLSPLLFVAPTAADGCAEFVDLLVTSAHGRDIPLRAVPLLDVDVDDPHYDSYTLFVAPALLDDSRQASLLMARPFDTIVVCRKGSTSVGSVVDVGAILEANGTSIKGMVIVDGPVRGTRDGRQLRGASGVGAEGARC